MTKAGLERQGLPAAARGALFARGALTPLRALQHRNFRLFFAGQFVSLSGSWMQSVAQLWLVYRLTGSAAALGWVAFAGQVPFIVFTFFGGALADHYSRRRILLVTQTLAMLLAFGLAFLTFTGNVRIWHVVVLATLLGVVNAFELPARQSFLVNLVGKKDLINAIALNSSAFSAARVLGPAAAGVVVANAGEAWCFLLNAVSYCAVIAGLSFMRVGPFERPEGRAATLRRILEGFRCARAIAPVRALLLLVGVISLVGLPYTAFIPIFAGRILDGDSQKLGWLMSAAGLGALAGALALATRRGPVGLERWAAGGALGFGASLVLFSSSRTFALSLPALVLAGFSTVTLMGGANSLVQTLVPDEFRGRVMSLYLLMLIGMEPLGALGAGLLAENFGVPIVVACGGLVCAAAGVLLWLYFRALKGARGVLPGMEPDADAAPHAGTDAPRAHAPEQSATA